MPDRQSFVPLIPLVALTIAFAEFRFDHTLPRWQSPYFWASLITTVVLLIGVQILRYTGKSKSRPMAKPDYSATSIVRRGGPLDGGL